MEISPDVGKWYRTVHQTLNEFIHTLDGSFSDEERRQMMDALGEAGSDYRWKYYSHGLSCECVSVWKHDVLEFLDLAQKYVEHSLRANKRHDNLYHAYNILHLANGSANIGRLSEMLEGQVAILSSGMLSGQESLELLESLKNSRLYRADQNSYILYPDRELPGFLEKNTITVEQLRDIPLIAELARAQDKSLIVVDEVGNYHFSGHIHNAKDVKRALNKLQEQFQYAELVKLNEEKVLSLFEHVFHHNEFTGRSGTFFAYEGLGSIYWHMVSKLLLAVQETILRTQGEASNERLKQIYTDVRTGLSFNKTPAVYGAFPTDPYSHTPKGQGAKQPGMTGLVKEEILTRQAELGMSVEHGKLAFDMLLFNPKELLGAPSKYSYVDINGQMQTILLEPNSLAYTICQTPVVIQAAEKQQIIIHYSDGTSQIVNGASLDDLNSQHILQRDGVIHQLTVHIK
jgi:hypothetical protein